MDAKRARRLSLLIVAALAAAVLAAVAYPHFVRYDVVYRVELSDGAGCEERIVFHSDGEADFPGRAVAMPELTWQSESIALARGEEASLFATATHHSCESSFECFIYVDGKLAARQRGHGGATCNVRLLETTAER